MSLQNLQMEFKDSLLAIDEKIDGVFPLAHLQIYRNNLFENLSKGLANAYPLIVKLVGDEFFQYLANEYIERYPSRSGDLYDYGEYFSVYLEEIAKEYQLPYLIEVAEFEWIIHQLYHAVEPPECNFDVLNKLDPELYPQLHFAIHPASFMKTFNTPILKIIELCEQETEEPLVLDSARLPLLILRRDYEIVLINLTPAEFTFLTELKNDKSLSDAITAAVTLDLQFNLEEKLPEWIAQKILISCSQEVIVSNHV